MTPSLASQSRIYPGEMARARRRKSRGIAKRFAIDNVAPMCRAQTLFRTLTWCSVILLASLSLLTAEHIARSGMRGEFDHFLAYAGSASIAVGALVGEFAAALLVRRSAKHAYSDVVWF
jgi:hypothetical protein